MIIDGNPKEKAAMAAFHRKDRAEAHRLQDEFIEEFRNEYNKKDHCSCKVACKYHGKCKECVAIHRGHQDHVPNCMREMLNIKLKILSELTEHSFVKEMDTNSK